MILEVNGDINLYYVQTLCMIFFPGAKFSKEEKEDPKIPKLRLCVSTDNDGSVTARVHLQLNKRNYPNSTYLLYAIFHPIYYQFYLFHRLYLGVCA